MLTTPEIAAVLDRVGFMPSWTFRVYDGDREGQHLTIRAGMWDAYRPGEQTTLDIQTFLPPIPDETYLIRWLRWRLRRAWLHEVDEWLSLDGRRPFDPHAPHADRDLP